MADHVDKAKRSEIMRAVRRRDTGPEMLVRKMLRELGVRYRVDYKAAPGRPDIAFPGRRKAIFVHGCFWHGHAKCRYGQLPKTKLAYWASKVAGNRARDKRKALELRADGWKVLVIWQCQVRHAPVAVQNRIASFLLD